MSPFLPVLIFLSLAAGMAGVWLPQLRRNGGAGGNVWLSSILTGILVGLAVVAVEPGAAPLTALLPALLGFAFCAAVDHGLEPVCIHCAQQEGSRSLAPLVILTGALGLHALADGALLALGGPIAWGVLLHRLPESFAAGILLRAAAPRSRHAILALALLQGISFVGCALAASAPTASLSQMAALGAGCLAYLGLHGLHDQAREAPRTLWLSLLAGLLTRALIH